MRSLVELGDTMRERAEADPRAEIVIGIERGRAQAGRMAEVLTRQGIRVLRTLEDSTERVESLGEGDDEEVFLPAGSFRVPLAQPAYSLVRSLLDLHVAMDDGFIEEEEERARRGLHSRVYDVTAWSMILCFGLDAWASRGELEIPSEPVEIDVAPAPSPVPDARVGWVLPCTDNAVYSALASLWDEDVVVHCALDGVAAADRRYPRGTLVVKRSVNGGRSDLPDLLSEIAVRTGVRVEAVDSSYSGAGPSLGSDRVVVCRQPRIGLVTGPGVSPLSAGALTWLFEERYGLDFTVLLREKLEDIAIEEFDVIVVPELQGGSTLPLDRLDGWVREGRVLVAIGSASLALIEDEPGDGEAWTTVRRVDDLAQLGDETGRLGDFDVGPVPESTEAMDVLPPERRPLRVPGAIFRVGLDDQSFLTLGKGEEIAVPVLSDRILTPSIGGHTVGRISAENPRIAGYTWPVMEEALKGQAWLVEERRGRGKVVLFAEDPSFRGTWEGLHALLLNAVMIGPNVTR
jgi:hypothetical protein